MQKLLTAGTTTMPSSVLGAGSYGIAIALDDKTVVKFTTSRQEYKNATRLQGRRLKTVWSVYAAGECNDDTADTVRAIASRRGSRVASAQEIYFIIGERLQKPKDGEFVRAFRSYDYRAMDRFRKRVNNELRREFPDERVYHSDVHAGNVLLRGRAMVAFDVQ